MVYEHGRKTLEGIQSLLVGAWVLLESFLLIRRTFFGRKMLVVEGVVDDCGCFGLAHWDLLWFFVLFLREF
jgi:hypothetical protein